MIHGTRMIALCAVSCVAVLLACSKREQSAPRSDSANNTAETQDATDIAARGDKHAPDAKAHSDSPMGMAITMGSYVNPEDSFPRLRYFDTDLVSINDRCAVRKTRLNPKMPPIYVNGRPVGFC